MPLPDAGFTEYAMPGKYGMSLSSMFWKYECSPYIPLQIILVNLHWQKKKKIEKKNPHVTLSRRSISQELITCLRGREEIKSLFLPMLHCDIFQDISIKYL